MWHHDVFIRPFDVFWSIFFIAGDVGHKINVSCFEADVSLIFKRPPRGPGGHSHIFLEGQTVSKK
jgi:hypothetical protein